MEGLLSPNFFLSVVSAKALLQRGSLMKLGTSMGRFSCKIAVLNFFREFLKNIRERAHIQHSCKLSVCALS